MLSLEKKGSKPKVVPGLAVIGGGIWASHHMNAVRDLEREGRARLLAMCARTPETVARITSEYGIEGTTDYRELLDRPDIHAVSIVTPDHLHREMAVAAMRAGKHVIVEKPMDLSVEGCDEMICVARDQGVLLFVDFHKRYDPVHQRARDLIRSGKLGQVQYGYTYMEDKIVVPRDWFPKWASHTTPFWFLGVHQVDLLRWTLGAEVVRVSGRGFKGRLQQLNIETYDSVHADLEFTNGAAFSVDVSWILPEGFEATVNQGFRVLGTEGIIELDTQDRGATGCFAAATMESYNVNAAHKTQNAFGETIHSGYFVEPVKEFVRIVTHILMGGDLAPLAGSYPSGNDGREATRVALAVHQSMETCAPVTVPIQNEACHRD